MSEWKFVGKPDPVGHRFYRRDDMEGLFVADDSGQYPDECDDAGALGMMIDTEKTMRIYVDNRIAIRVDVPCMGGRFFMASPLEALWLSSRTTMVVTYPAQVMNLAALFEVAKPSF